MGRVISTVEECFEQRLFSFEDSKILPSVLKLPFISLFTFLLTESKLAIKYGDKEVLPHHFE